MNKVRGYIFSRPFMGERIPQNIQNLAIRDFCSKNDLDFLLSATEYAMADSFLMLANVLDELPQIDGIVAYSLFQLPENDQERQLIFQSILKLNKSFYFALVGLHASTATDFSRIDTLWKVKKTLPRCYLSQLV